MSTIKRKLYTFFHTPRIVMKKFASSPIFRLLPDKLSLKIQYKNIFLKPLNLKNPQTFNEKLQWLKLYDRKPEYSTMVDKYEAKKYVASIIGEEYIIPTYGVYNSFDEIDFDALPEQFVLKCTHGSGDIIICKDKSSFDINQARSKLTKSLNTNYYKISREWPYKNVKPRIIAEKYMIDDSTDCKSLSDYKFFCFNGKYELLVYIKDRDYEQKTALFAYFDKNLSPCNVLQEGEIYAGPIDLPNSVNTMIELAQKIASNLIQARIDFYYINSQIYFGEITFFNAGGFSPFYPEEWDDMLGAKIHLPQKSR